MGARLWIPLALLAPSLLLTAYVLETQGVVGFYREAFSSPATILMSVDLSVSLGLVIVWMWRDARETDTPFTPYVVVTLAIGVAGPLGYLVHRALGEGRRYRRRTRNASRADGA
jgi:hypothetical protein